jgi:RNA polymerase sigma-70 factor (ECF subfamily)
LNKARKLAKNYHAGRIFLNIAVNSMADSPDQRITELLQLWSSGNEDALEQLTPFVYRELHRLAAHYMGLEKPGHTLQATALVNEAYVRLINWKDVEWQSRAHFIGFSAQLMRRILVDYARSHLFEKRGGNVRPVSLDDAPPLPDERLMGMLDVDLALERLAQIDERKARIVELRYFGGLTVEETAAALEISTITVIRSWNFSKAWLLRELKENA